MKRSEIVILIVLLLLVIILRVPSLLEPYWHGDEGITLTVGQVIRHGGILYKDVADNKTPLLYFLAALAKTLPNLRLILFFWVILTTIVFFFFSRSLLKKTGSLIISSIFFVFLTSLPIIEGNIANGEIFFLLPNLLGISLSWYGYRKKKNSFFLAAGVFLGLGFLFKPPAVFEFLAVYFFLFCCLLSQKKLIIKVLSLLAVGFLIPNIMMIFYFFIKSAIKDYWEYAFKWNFIYSSWKNGFLIPLSFLFFLLLFFKFKKRLSPFLSLIILWFLFSLAGSLLSVRHYLHYFIPLVASFSLFWGYIFDYHQKIFIVSLLTFFTFIILKTRGPVNYQFSYYRNFSEYILGKKDINTYRSFFDPHILRTYKIADFLENAKEGTIFIWANEPLLYPLSERKPVGRFSAAYNIVWEKSREIETIELLRKNPPVYILKDSALKYNFPELDKFISEEYNFLKEVDKIFIYDRSKPGFFDL